MRREIERKMTEWKMRDENEKDRVIRGKLIEREKNKITGMRKRENKEKKIPK